MQELFIFLAALTWLGGGNLLFFRHYERRGMPGWSIFNPLRPPRFHGAEWLSLFGLALLSLFFGWLGLFVFQR